MGLPGQKAEMKAGRAEAQVVDFEVVFEEHWSRVHRIVARIVGDTDEAEDVALEVFWRLYRRLDGISTAKNEIQLGGWLYRVATNLGLNALRARRRRERYEWEAGRAVREAASVLDPAAEVEDAEERSRVRLALSRIRPRSARLLILRYSGLSYAELAEAVGLSRNSVGTLLARAEREFEQCYGEVEGG